MSHCRKIAYVIRIKMISVCVVMCVRMLLFMLILNTKKYLYKSINKIYFKILLMRSRIIINTIVDNFQSKLLTFYYQIACPVSEFYPKYYLNIFLIYDFGKSS